jgi:uncharacterized protein YhaN
MWLEKADVDRYGPLVDCRPPCKKGLTVVSGPNEAGKTLYLEALLQLLDSDTNGRMDPNPRVNESPQGRVEVRTGGDIHALGNGTNLSDVSPVEPRHLSTVFVVRDNDLELPNGQDYYTSLIEKLGDIHTSEINQIQSEIKRRGRLTKKNLNVSAKYDDAKDVRNKAKKLVDDISDYVQKAEREDLDKLERRRLQCKEELQESQGELAEQKKAKKVDKYERLSNRLSTYRSTSKKISELDDFDRGTLESLREFERNASQGKDDLRDIEEKIEKKTEVVESLDSNLEEHKDKRNRLKSRESAVENARSELEKYRNKEDNISSVKRRLELTKKAAVGGLLGGGIATGAGAVAGQGTAVGIGVILLITAGVAGLLYRSTNQNLSEIESADSNVLRSARDAGLEVESIDGVAARITEYEENLKQAGNKVSEIKGELNAKEKDLKELKKSRNELEDKVEKNREKLEDKLKEGSVDSTDEYEKRVEEKEELTGDRKEAQQSLLDSLGEPDSENPEARADFWEQKLESIVDSIEDSEVDAEVYDENDLEAAKTRVEELSEEVENIEEELEEHAEKIEEFERRAGDISTEPFVGTNVSLESRTIDGLEQLAENLEEVVKQIESDAELSRKALKIFERIEDQEEQKLTELFDPDGPASTTFERLTDGNYTEVAYDPDSHELVVHRHDGREFRPDELSQGTKDQLYFASRVSLAQQILGNETGFFLLDDPFIAADPERLDNGFQTLFDLEKEGWQILYFTAKEEIYNGMVDKYGIDHIDMTEYSQ